MLPLSTSCDSVRHYNSKHHSRWWLKVTRREITVLQKSAYNRSRMSANDITETRQKHAFNFIYIYARVRNFRNSRNHVQLPWTRRVVNKRTPCIACFETRINLHPANCHPFVGKDCAYGGKPLNETLLMNCDTSNCVCDSASLLDTRYRCRWIMWDGWQRKIE